MRSICLGLLAALLAGSAATASPQKVRIDTGEVSGVTAGEVVSFKGLPYAEPPVGSLRWRPPQRAKAWEGVRVADRYGAICMQKIAKDNGVGLQPASEDCLTLNVFAPVGATTPAKLPVMVWIHGGGLVNGSGTAELYDGSALARQGVVVVTINYRLGRFGYFAHSALTAEAKGGLVANYGLMDQIAALEWVKRNVAAFGGDARNVTIFGESAGGVSVNRLMMIPAVRGLFQKAIVESGAGRETDRSLTEAEAAGAAFATGLGATDAAALRAIPADAIVAAGDLNMLKNETLTLDGRLLTRTAMDAFNSAATTARIPYLIGSNDLEIPGAFAGSFRLGVKLTDAQKPGVVAAYGGQAAYDEHVVTDAVFGEPARTLAKAQAKTGAPVWLYRFSVLSAGAPKALKGAVHASDRQYVFQTMAASPWPTDARDAALASTISAYWVAFAKTGDPNGAGRPAWPRYDASDRLLEFTNAGPVAKVTPDAAALDAIAGSYGGR